MKKSWWCITFICLTVIPVIYSCSMFESAEPALTPTATIKPNPTPTPTLVPEGLIVVDPSQMLQTIKDVGGGNFIHKYSGREDVLDPVGEMNISTLGTRYARVWMGLKDWEANNDNDDAEIIDWAAFTDDGYTHRTFQLMQKFQAQDMTIIATIWEVPDWMVYDPTSDRSRWIPPEMYPETVESITAWLLLARDTYGVEIDYISFNEPILGVSTALTSQEQRQMILQSGTRFNAEKLKTKWLLGDCAGISNCLTYAKYIYGDPQIKQYLGPMAVHSWDALDAKSIEITRVADFVQSEGLDLWVTEGGWDPFLYARSEEFPSWRNALNLSAVYNRVLQLSGATVLMYWEFLGDDYSTNDGEQPYPILEQLQQLTQTFPAGTIILKTGVNTSQVYAVAGKINAGYVLHIVSTSDQVKSVKVLGMPPGTYAYTLSTSQIIGQDAGLLNLTDKGLDFELAPESVHILSMQQ